MGVKLILHALREIWNKPPLLMVASLTVIVLAAFFVSLLVIVFAGKRKERGE